MTDHYEKLNFAELWLKDGLLVSQSPGLLEIVEVDMTTCQAIVEQLRQTGIKGTYTHLFVRATSLVLQRHLELHQLVSGSQQL